MNKLKPYLFWIIAGAIALAELITLVLMLPDVDVVGDKKLAMEAKQSLDREYKHLQELDTRAARGEPTDKFDAEKADDVRRLTDSYLVTPAWKSVLEAQVGQYDKALLAIKTYLSDRSKPLHVPVADSADKQIWYQTYEAQSAELLRQLHAEGRLTLPTKSREKETAESKEVDFASDAAVREVAGLYTKGVDFPDAKEHPLLTGRFRVIEQVVAALRRAKAGPQANPVASGPTDAPAGGIAQITSLRWEGSDSSSSVDEEQLMRRPMVQASMPETQAADGSLPLQGDIAPYASGRHLTLSLQGSLPALMAAEAALEHGDPEGPVLVVTSFNLQRKKSFTMGERKSVPAEAVTARVGVLVLDFKRALEATAQIPPPQGAPAPRQPAHGRSAGRQN